MKTIFTVNLINEKGEITYSTDFFDKTEAMMYIKRTETANTLEGLRAVIKEYISEEKEKPQEVLASYTSEELLFEVHKRRNIYIEGWYNADHINNNTDLPMQHCDVFIKWACDTACDEDLEVAVEQWLDKMKEELHSFLADTIFEYIKGFGYLRENKRAYLLFLQERISVVYDADLGIYAEIDLSYKEGDMQLRTEQPFTKEDAEIIIFDLMNVYKPHQGNLKTHLEEKMQELINDYIS